jgi:hypothetical protein
LLIFNLRIVKGVIRRNVQVDFLTQDQANLTGLPDLQVLALAAAEHRLVVSHDVRTMPSAFAESIASQNGGGLILLSQNLPIGEAIHALLRIWEESTAEERQNRIAWLSL